MSLFRRIWQRIRLSHYVGRDLEGNRFYERPSSTDDPTRTKRTIEYRRPGDMWHYIGGGRRLPVQWSTWLSHTRPDPPTLEELQADLGRQRRVLQGAALIEARDKEERGRALRLADAARFSDPRRGRAIQNDSPVIQDEFTESFHGLKSSTATQIPVSGRKAKLLDTDLPRIPADSSYKPEPWAPKARIRGGS